MWFCFLNATQFSMRIPPKLDERIKEYADHHRITKSKIMSDVVNHDWAFSSHLTLTLSYYF